MPIPGCRDWRSGFIKSCPQPVLDLFAKFKANGA